MRGLARVLAVLLAAAACAPAAPVSAPAPDSLAGRYLVSGGSSALPAVEALTEAFAKLHPGVVWVIEDVGSDAGMTLTANGSVDVGMISRDLKESERGLVETLLIGLSGTAVTVNAANPVQDLKKAQVRDIFTGVVTDWSAVGGLPGRIVVLVREKGSTTRDTFERFFFEGKAAYVKDVTEVYEVDEVVKTLRSLKQAIGMVTANDENRQDSTIRLLAIDGVTPSRENLASGAYKIRRPLYLVYHPTKLKPGIRAFLDFVRSPEGQRIVSRF